MKSTVESAAGRGVGEFRVEAGVSNHYPLLTDDLRTRASSPASSYFDQAPHWLSGQQVDVKLLRRLRVSC